MTEIIIQSSDLCSSAPIESVQSGGEEMRVILRVDGREKVLFTGDRFSPRIFDKRKRPSDGL